MENTILNYFIDNWISILAVVISFCAAIFTFLQYRISIKTFQETIRPSLSVELVSNHKNTHPNIIYFFIKNDGFSTAFDINFDISENDNLSKLISDMNFVKLGIPNMVSKSKIETFLFSAISNKDLLNAESKILITYKNLKNKEYKDSLILTAKHLVGLISCKSNSKLINDNLCKIDKSIKNLNQTLKKDLL
jgi:hypothetical protein